MVIWHPIMNDQTLSFARDQWEAKSCFLKKDLFAYVYLALLQCHGTYKSSAVIFLLKLVTVSI